ncbi:PIN domain-containing protein [candidate division KSB1 bacterium]|nr:PIN domain-containing protein [candidate division KSB1 bacterium]
MNIFVDTGAFYALADEDDEYHTPARAYYASNFKPGLFVTSEYVFVESWLLIHHRLGQAAARKFWDGVRSKVIRLRQVSAQNLERAWEILNEYQDQDFSLVDCTSFAIMEDLKITAAFAFDHHFYVFRSRWVGPFQCYPS